MANKGMAVSRGKFGTVIGFETHKDQVLKTGFR
jgi:hypothetical protein